MEEIALHILDVAENSIAASARVIEVRVVEDEAADMMTVEIADDGNGMAAEMLAKVRDPFFTTKPTRRTGLGVPMFAQATREAGGGFSIESAPGTGTRMVATFGLGHPDRMPLGDLRETMAVLAGTHPEVDFACEHVRNGVLLYRQDTRATGVASDINGRDE
jgi:hypothetical protein